MSERNDGKLKERVIQQHEMLFKEKCDSTNQFL